MIVSYRKVCSGQPVCSVNRAFVFFVVFLFLSLCAQAHIGQIYKSARTIDTNSNRSDGRKFPILRAIVSQFISDRSSRDTSPAVAKEEEISSAGSEPQSIPSHPKTKSQLQESSSKSRNNVKTIQHIIEDINSQNSKISSKRRKHFLVNILSRMLKSVNFTEVSLNVVCFWWLRMNRMAHICH